MDANSMSSESNQTGSTLIESKSTVIQPKDDIQQGSTDLLVHKSELIKHLMNLLETDNLPRMDESKAMQKCVDLFSDVHKYKDKPFHDTSMSSICPIMKQIVNYGDIYLKQKIKKECPIYQQIVAFSFFHAKQCREKCTVPSCSSLKEMIQKKGYVQSDIFFSKIFFVNILILFLNVFLIR